MDEYLKPGKEVGDYFPWDPYHYLEVDRSTMEGRDSRDG